MNSSGIRAKDLRLTGDYAFDGAEDIEIDGGVMLSKDAFWNCSNVRVSNSTIVGEYLGWNSRGLTFENCLISSHQALCYVDDLRLEGCTFLSADLVFEYSVVDAEVLGTIESVRNPAGGSVRCTGIGELTLDPRYVDPAMTTFETLRPQT